MSVLKRGVGVLAKLHPLPSCPIRETRWWWSRWKEGFVLCLLRGSLLPRGEETVWVAGGAPRPGVVGAQSFRCEHVPRLLL